MLPIAKFCCLIKVKQISLNNDCIFGHNCSCFHLCESFPAVATTSAHRRIQDWHVGSWRSRSSILHIHSGQSSSSIFFRQPPILNSKILLGNHLSYHHIRGKAQWSCSFTRRTTPQDAHRKCVPLKGKLQISKVKVQLSLVFHLVVPQTKRNSSKQTS